MGFVNYGIAGDAANFRLKDNSTSNIVLYTPYANTTNFEFSSTQLYAMAKGARAIRWDVDKQAKLVVEMESYDLTWLGILLGGTWSTGSFDIAKREVLTVNTTNQVTIKDTPKTGSVAIFKLLADNVGHSTPQTLGNPATTENTYALETKTFTFNATSCPVNTMVVVYYLTESVGTAQTLSITADLPASSYEIIGDTTIQRKHDGVDEFVQFKCGHAKPIIGSTITLSASGVTNLTATFDLMPDASGEIITFSKL